MINDSLAKYVQKFGYTFCGLNCSSFGFVVVVLFLFIVRAAQAVHGLFGRALLDL